MTQHQMNELVGEITAINEEISEFSAQGHNVNPLIAERNGLVGMLEWAMYKAVQKDREVNLNAEK